MEDKDLFILYRLYHGCWYPGDTRGKRMSDHAIDLVVPDCSGFSIRGGVEIYPVKYVYGYVVPCFVAFMSYFSRFIWSPFSLQWHHNEHDGASNHQPHDCLLNRLFMHRSKKTSMLRVTGFVRGIQRWPAQKASNAENVFIWWRHHLLTWLKSNPGILIRDAVEVWEVISSHTVQWV